MTISYWATYIATFLNLVEFLTYRLGPRKKTPGTETSIDAWLRSLHHGISDTTAAYQNPPGDS